MSEIVLSLTALLATIGIGGGVYELAVVDSIWPKRPEIIQPDRGGISRKRFWIPAHVLFEIFLIVSLVVTWSHPMVRNWLLVALASHAVMRVWPAFDFIPKALAFERTPPSGISEQAAKRWVMRSRLRVPLDLATFGEVMSAFWTVAHGIGA